jgi:hypothetical protein
MDYPYNVYMPFYPETMVLNLAPDETLLLADKVLYTCNGGKKEPATIFFSDKNTLYCVTTKGTIKKTYTSCTITHQSFDGSVLGGKRPPGDLQGSAVHRHHLFRREGDIPLLSPGCRLL